MNLNKWHSPLEYYNEWLKCKDDALYFLQNYYFIDNIKGKSPFFSQIQKDNIDLYNTFNKSTIVDDPCIIYKDGRGCGKTTLLIGLALHKVLFSTNKVYIYIRKNSRCFANKIFEAYDILPDFLKVPIIEPKSDSFMSFSNKSEIQFIKNYIYVPYVCDYIFADEYEYFDDLGANILSLNYPRFLATTPRNYNSKEETWF